MWFKASPNFMCVWKMVSRITLDLGRQILDNDKVLKCIASTLLLIVNFLSVQVIDLKHFEQMQDSCNIVTHVFTCPLGWEQIVGARSWNGL